MFDIRDLFSKHKPLVGLDIGSSSLKLVEIQETPKGYVLSRFSQIAVPKGLIVDGVLSEPEQLGVQIKEVFKRSGCRIKAVVTSLSGHSVIVKKVSFTTMDEEELRELIRDEVSKYLPFDNMEEINFDFQILGENEYNPNLMEVILVAAKKDIIDNYTEAITGVGLMPIIMDVDSFALETMYEENYDYEDTDVAILINIGASITNINVVKNGTSIFTRDFTLGGNSITETIQNHLSITFDEAEAIKTGGPEEMQPLREQGVDSILTFADPICMEIERSIDYFRSTFGGDEVKQVLLSGGGALIPGIAGELTQRLGIDTELIDPFRKIGYNQKVFDKDMISKIGPIAAVGVGLALRKLGDK